MENNLMPKEIINSFYQSINNLLKQGIDKAHPSIQRELKRILIVNGNKIPDKIKTLIDNGQNLNKEVDRNN